MARIVMKFGGTSMAGIERIRGVAARAMEDAEAKGDGRAFFDGLSKGFITLTSGDGNPYIKISYRTLKDAQDAHGMLIAAIRAHIEQMAGE